ncbi:SLC13 family permease [Paenibacillus sp. NPDC056579]|uniref:SLC13 family permease n=1 Tax=Paenibacillus sp. NPDC056579 TaxID=3345871 RepID=UPI0036B45EC6
MDVSAHALWQVVAAALIFIVCFGLMITGLFNRLLVVWAGALLMLLLGLVSGTEVVQTHIGWQTIFLMTGIMVLSGITGKTGLYEYITIRCAQKTGGRYFLLLVALAVIAAVGSAALDAVTTMIVMIPMTIRLAKRLNANPFSLLVTVMASGTIGGSATMIGSIPNMMIGSSQAAGLTFNGFLVHVAPLSVLCFAVIVLVLYRLYAKEWKPDPAHISELMALDASSFLSNRTLLVKACAVWGLTLLGFLFQLQLRIPIGFIALAGALVLVLISVRKKEDLVEIGHSVEWGTLGWLAGLFILVGGLADTGIMEAIALKGMELTSGNPMLLALLVLWVSAIGSAVVDQAIVAASSIPLVKQWGIQLEITAYWQLNPVWWSLSIGASLGGMATWLGSQASLVAAGLALKEGHELSLKRYVKVAVPLTLLALLIATLYIVLMYFD